MTDSTVTDLAKKAKAAEAAAKKAIAAAKSAKDALKADRPPVMTIVRTMVVEDETVTTDRIMEELKERGHTDAKQLTVQGMSSDAISFLKLLRSLGRLKEIEPAPDPVDDDEEPDGETDEEPATLPDAA